MKFWSSYIAFDVFSLLYNEIKNAFSGNCLKIKVFIHSSKCYNLKAFYFNTCY